MEDGVRRIGDRLELFLDDWLIDRLQGGASKRLHEPTPREEALRTDAPWEGCRCGYHTAFRDGAVYRLYYKSHHSHNEAKDGGGVREVSAPLRVAYAESADGIRWTRPRLGIYEIDGSRDNNVVWEGVGPARIGTHGFAPFKDANPAALPEARYKALGTKYGQGAEDGLYGMRSPDGIHWSLVDSKALITSGKFDSQNTGFWDGARGQYRAYLRDFHGGTPEENRADASRMGIRDIRTCTSADFLHWSEPEPLRYEESAEEGFYVNQIAPYYRAPHILIGFPARYVERPWSPAVENLPDLEDRRTRSAVSMRYGTVSTDTVLIASRDGVLFTKRPEVYLRPGPQRPGSWVYGDAFVSWGLFETESPLPGAPPELSFLAVEHYWQGAYTVFRRYATRIDGFVSVHADGNGGEMVTNPLSFDGDGLYVNFSGSAAGGILVELQTPSGEALPGFSLGDCVETAGDAIERRILWKGGASLGALRGTPVRLRFRIRDADLYSLRFR